MKFKLFLFGFVLFFAVRPVAAEDISLEQVVLRGLDKVTGRLSSMTVNVGEKATFGALDVYVRVCYTHPPEETPENAAYLDIVENKEEGQLKLFSGWMFSSSPVLSAMDHAVYDIWVLKCQGEPVVPPKPQMLVLENPIEPVAVQPKLKIILEDDTDMEASVPAAEETDDVEEDRDGQDISEKEVSETQEETSSEEKTVLVPLEDAENSEISTDVSEDVSKNNEQIEISDISEEASSDLKEINGQIESPDVAVETEDVQEPDMLTEEITD